MMIIVSQDRTAMIFSKNIISIWINNPFDNDSGEFSIEVSADVDECLGYYKTEKRAKEVFETIINTFRFNKCEAIERENTVYYMPSE